MPKSPHRPTHQEALAAASADEPVLLRDSLRLFEHCRYNGKRDAYVQAVLAAQAHPNDRAFAATVKTAAAQLRSEMTNLRIQGTAVHGRPAQNELMAYWVAIERKRRGPAAAEGQDAELPVATAEVAAPAPARSWVQRSAAAAQPDTLDAVAQLWRR